MRSFVYHHSPAISLQGNATELRRYWAPPIALFLDDFETILLPMPGQSAAHFGVIAL